MSSLAVLATHPIQYHAPVYRAVQREFGVPVTAIYGSDFSVAGYRDPEFGNEVRWDGDLLSGYTPRFLERVAERGAATMEAVRGKGIREALKEVRPGAILLTGYAGAFHRRAWRAALEAGVPLLFRAETSDAAMRRGRVKQWGRDFLLKRMYRRCAALLPIGAESRRHYERLARGVPTFFAPYCVDTAPFRTDEAARRELRGAMRAELEIGEGQAALLFSGKLVAKKDPLLLVRAVKALPEAVRRKMVLVYLGDGELRGAIEAEAGRAPAVALRMAGFRNQSELSPFYHAADLLALPSAFGETWGLVVNEALHHGLPAIVSDRVGCAPDLIETGQTGAIFPAGSARDLASAIERMLPRVGQAAAREACRAKVAGYSVHDAAAGIAEAFRHVTRGAA